MSSNDTYTLLLECTLCAQNSMCELRHLRKDAPDDKPFELCSHCSKLIEELRHSTTKVDLVAALKK